MIALNNIAKNRLYSLAQMRKIPYTIISIGYFFKIKDMEG